MEQFTGEKPERWHKVNQAVPQPSFTRSISTIEVPEQCVKSVQS